LLYWDFNGETKERAKLLIFYQIEQTPLAVTREATMPDILL
jgi:hypothetical protein